MADSRFNWICEEIENGLHDAGLNHLKVTARGESIVIYSEYNEKKENRCRFTHLSDQTYLLGVANHNGKWEITPFEGAIDELLDIVINQFGWVLCNYD
jgi:hypothetical protein